ncbi:F0F1 ATP synthase subunit delta [Compostimonas suwonensis]|uniref:ATP synthase subunit delta n=1 Tax=Compostimonas suwonensis TaxID=1048394 RepID=A0A2M9BUF6_9MICO|nr:F0F1 ATP synthase subunit delta [Compostimonas suwonensis]PJJ61585.1 F-type H+-transporting ATPase subunit delta [Compostimonas suwonensis]
MGSATREALVESRAALAAADGVDLATAQDLLAAGRTLGRSTHLLALVADPSMEAGEKKSLVERVFGSLIGSTALSLLISIAESRWSSSEQLLAGIEELGLRAAAISAPADADIEGELFAFGTAVRSNAELELALSSKLGDDASKAALVEKLLGATASTQTIAIASQLVQQPRGRRIGELLASAAAIIADESGLAVATVTAATPLGEAQIKRLSDRLGEAYGRSVKVNEVIDPTLIGGLRVQIGDDVIDGSIATRLNELRLKLVG